MASEFQRGLDQGREEGNKQAYKDILDFLEGKYLHPRITRESTEGKAILKIAREVAQKMRNEGKVG